MRTRRFVQRTLWVALGAGVLTMPSCLTRMLWADDPTNANLIQTDTICQIHSVTGNFYQVARADDLTPSGAIEIEFSTPTDKTHTHPELRGYHADSPGRMRLHPPQTESNWLSLPGAKLLRPRFWNFGAYRATYFHQRQASVPVVFVGDMAPAEAGSVTTSAAAPPHWKRLREYQAAAADHELATQGITAFEKRNWLQLLKNESGYTERDTSALAWLDGAGNVVHPAELAAHLQAARERTPGAVDLSQYTLLGRLDGAWGETLYVKVPLPVLIQGEGLELKRLGDRVFWRREQVWTGDLLPSSAPEPSPPTTTTDQLTPPASTAPATLVAAHSIPMLADQFVYTYSVENPGDPILWVITKCLLTPPAILLDVAAQTSVFYVDILRWMASGKNQDWTGPFAPERKR